MLLERNGGDVNAAANAFFDHGATTGPPPAYSPHDAPVDAIPVAQQVPPPDGTVVSVTCPEGIGPGCELQVQTDQGMMRVQVPAGVGPGAAFLVRLPPGPPSALAYPGQAQQPNHHFMQPQPQTIHVVHSSPYYGGCTRRPPSHASAPPSRRPPPTTQIAIACGRRRRLQPRLRHGPLPRRRDGLHGGHADRGRVVVLRRALREDGRS